MATLYVPFTTAVSFHESVNARAEDITDDGVTVSTEFICAWADRITLARDLRGWIEDVGADRIVHLPYTLSGWANQPARRVRASGFGDPVQNGDYLREVTYSKARLAVSFEATGNESGGGDDNPFVTESIEGAAEFLRLSPEKLYWDNAQTEPVEDVEAPGKLMRMLDWTLQITEIASLPSGLFNLVGFVNDATASSARFGHQFEAETLLFQPPRIVRKVNENGDGAWSLDLKFTWRASGWNKWHRSGQTASGVWDPVPMYDASGNELKVYEPVDFSPVMALLQ